MNNSEKPYQPSEEEMQKAEGMLTPMQKDLSKRREFSTEKLKELGLEGSLQMNGSHVSGVINGHSIDIPLSVSGRAMQGGTINGNNELDLSDANRFLDKVAATDGAVADISNEDVYYANDEVAEQARLVPYVKAQEILKEMGI
jgi:hypothetical protein